jgi:nitroreductase
MDLMEALASRRSARAYLDTPVPDETIERILAAASRAPSGTNTQPWKVYVVSGSARDALCRAACEAREREPHREANHSPFGEYLYYSIPMTEPYYSRRRKVGWELYRLQGVAKGDRKASWTIAGRNFLFFDAPVGLIFTLERVLEKGSWIDLGIFLQSVMLAARSQGLDTCPQGAWAFYYDVVREQLGIPDNEIVVCGMALGFADPAAPANRLRSEREPLSSFVRFVKEPAQPLAEHA